MTDEEFERRLRQLEGPTVTHTVEDNEVLNSSELWVERYRPKTYLDLLSEENVNRTLLHWIKLWDKAVFNREVKLRVVKSDEATKPKWASSVTEGNKFDAKKKFEKFGGKFKANDGELKEELDAMGRPLQKIVLICGPPGLGKTTLAHVVAKHAGMPHNHPPISSFSLIPFYCSNRLQSGGDECQ